jgi:hypothetical protein
VAAAPDDGATGAALAVDDGATAAEVALDAVGAGAALGLDEGATAAGIGPGVLAGLADWDGDADPGALVEADALGVRATAAAGAGWLCPGLAIA